jgi:hypothetical protein
MTRVRARGQRSTFPLASVCLIGVTRWPSRLWNAALLVAHLAPLSIIVIANGVFVSPNSQRMAYTVALLVRGALALLETFALLWKAPLFTRSVTAR